MKIKILVLFVCFSALASIGFAQTKAQAGYIGNWSNIRAFQMSVDNAAITFDSKGNKTQTYKYRDITPTGSDIYLLEITDPVKDAYFSKFISVAMSADDSRKMNEMSATNYNSLADLKAGTNPQGNDLWIRDGASFDAETEQSDSISGTLQVGKTESVILYFGEESGDYAGYCFMNNSEAGKKILAACKDGEKCEFVGEIDGESPCKVPGLKADLSSSGKIMSVESVKSLAVKTKAAKDGKVITVANTPEQLVKDLYAAQKTEATNPFVQIENRALVDKYFAEDFADLVWKTNSSELGWNVDPLYNSQDPQITDFAVGAPKEDGGPDNVYLKVTFKSYGNAESVGFTLQREANKTWKISNIDYSDGEDLASILRYSTDEEFQKGHDTGHTFKGDYLVGTVPCDVAPTMNGMFYRVRCDGQEGFKLYAADGDENETAFIHTDDKGKETGKFVFKNGAKDGKFFDASGKEMKVSRVQ